MSNSFDEIIRQTMTLFLLSILWHKVVDTFTLLLNWLCILLTHYRSEHQRTWFIIDKMNWGGSFKWPPTCMKSDLPVWNLTYLYEAWPPCMKPDLPGWNLTYLCETWSTRMKPDLPVWNLTYLYETWPTRTKTDLPVWNLTYLHKTWPTCMK